MRVLTIPMRVGQDFALVMTVGMLGATSAASQDPYGFSSFIHSVFDVFASGNLQETYC